MCEALERMWAGSDVRLRMYPRRECNAPVSANDAMDVDEQGAADTAASNNSKDTEVRFDPLRDHQLDEELQINRYEGDEMRPIALVDGLEILGRRDVCDKRLHLPPNCDAQIIEGTNGITSTIAAQMARSIEYAKRANRPRIICESVDKFTVAAR